MFTFKSIDIRPIERPVWKMATSLTSGHDEIASCVLKASLPGNSNSLFTYSITRCFQATFPAIGKQLGFSLSPGKE